jgi:large subunit ribosomal protein L20
MLQMAKGYRFARSRKEKAAKEALVHAGNHAFAHRRRKKSDFRKLWTIRINALAREHGLSYSRLIDAMNKGNVTINRKMMADLAMNRPAVFGRVIDTVKK